MVALLPLLCFVLLFLGFQRRGRTGRADAPFRLALVYASVGWGVLLSAVTEMLSAVRAIAFGPVLAAWGLACLGALLFWRRAAARTPAPAPDDPSCSSGDAGGMRRLEPAVLGGIGIIALAAYLTAVISPPNNWDSLVYHLTRVMHWQLNRTITFYRTHIEWQNYHHPWAELAILHGVVLSGGDRFAALVQWFAFLGCASNGSYLAAAAGGSRRAQILAAGLFATVPMAVLQASSTQNDLVVSYWMTCFVCLLARFLREPGWRRALPLGLALGLALQTKGSTYIYATPFLAWLAIDLVRRRAWREPALLRAVTVAGLAAALVVLPHWVRNTRLYRSPFGPPQVHGYRLANEIHGPRVLASNLLRGAAIHIATPSHRVNNVIEHGVELAHSAMGLSPHDERTSWETPFHIRFHFHEDLTGNPIHVLVFAGLFVGVVFRRGLRPRTREERGLLSCSIAGILLFCWILKHQHYHSRLHLPFFVLLSAWAALVLDRSAPRPALPVLFACLFAFAGWCAVRNHLRPWTGPLAIWKTPRPILYFTSGIRACEPYLLAMQALEGLGVRRVGFSVSPKVLAEEHWKVREYPMWALTSESGIRFDNVNVTNVTRTLPCYAREIADHPEALVHYENPDDPVAPVIAVRGIPYALHQRFGPLSVYLP